ncbi:MAG: nucleotide pyrophosphohydrolase [Clostridia bacterium]|jgi:NTP pyrophosphatase (non-canonical NTP hydrolase)
MEKSDSILQLQKSVELFTEQRNWQTAHNPKNLSMSIAIEAAELMEIFQWISIDESKNISDPDVIVNVADELADVLIYCFSFANQFEFDVADIVREKMRKNNFKYPAKK